MEYVRTECDHSSDQFIFQPIGSLEKTVGETRHLISIDLEGSDFENQKKAGASSKKVIDECLLHYGDGFLKFSVSHSEPMKASNGTWHVKIFVQLNDQLLGNGQVGDRSSHPIDTIFFDGQAIHICPSEVTNYRPPVPNSPFGLACDRMGARGLEKLVRLERE